MLQSPLGEKEGITYSEKSGTVYFTFSDLQVQLMTDLENKQEEIVRLEEDVGSNQFELKEQVQSRLLFIVLTLFVYT